VAPPAPFEKDEIPFSLFRLNLGLVTELLSEQPTNIRIDNITIKINPYLYIVISFDFLNTIR
jgi:hypothetical protein